MSKTIAGSLSLTTAALIMMLSLACSSTTDVAGGTSIPNQAVGMIYTPDGAPAAGAEVVLLDDLVRTTLVPPAIDTTTTDDSGRYFFDNVKQGRYAIRATARDSSFVLVRADIEINVSGDTVEISADTLERGGNITGVVAPHVGMPLSMVIYNSHFVASVSSSGDFTIGPLPPNTYVVLTAMPWNAGLVAVHIDTINVVAGVTNRIDTIRTMPLGSGSTILDDFEDGDMVNRFNSSWWFFNDAAVGGHSVMYPGLTDSIQKALFAPGASGSPYCAHLSYQLGATSVRFAGLGCNLVGHYNGILQSRDLSTIKRLGLWIRGTGAPVSLVLTSAAPGTEVVYPLDIPSAPLAWSYYTANIDSLVNSRDSVFQNNWRRASPFIIQLSVEGLGAAGSSQELWIDSVTIDY